MKPANLTVRIDPALKRRAQGAARALDVSLSQVVTAALRGFCKEAPIQSSLTFGLFDSGVLDNVTAGARAELERRVRGQLRARLIQLDRLRKKRPLTDEEKAEEELLAVAQFRWD